MTTPLPPGAVLLTTDQAVTAILTGDHADAAVGDIAADLACIDAIRGGVILAAKTVTGQLVFARGPNHPNRDDV